MKSGIIIVLAILIYSIGTADTFDQDQPHTGHWRLSAGLAQSELGVRLFGAIRSVTVFSYLTEQGSPIPIIVASDPAWNRLVYGIGDNIWAHNGHFTGGLSSTPERLIFAPDVENDAVWVLYFNHESLPAVAPYPGYINTGDGPRDVCYDDGGTAAFGDDFFWAVHINEGTAKKYSYTFDPIYLNFTYEQSAVLSGLDNPISIARGRAIDNSCQNCDEYGHNEWLYVLEENGAIKCYTNNQVPPGNDPNIVHQFTAHAPVNTHLMSLTVDHTGIIWATDIYNSCAITFYNDETQLVELDRFGTYGTENSPGQILFPTDISFVEGVVQDVEYPEILRVRVTTDAAIQEMWTETTGGLRGDRGVDILNLSAGWDYPQDPVNRPVEITYKVTAFASISIHIINSSNVTIRTISRSDIPGDVAVIWDGKDDNGNQAPIDIYTIEICGHTVDFNTNSTPYFEVFEANSYSCIQDYLDSRTITYEVVDPNPENIEFHYHWEVDNGRLFHPDDPYHGYSVLDYDGDGVGTITYAPPRDWTSAAPGPGTSQIECTVSDLNGVASLSTMRIISFRRCGEECPFLYILNGSDTLRQNNILNASIDTSGGGNLVYDYIFLHDSPEPQSGRYEFFVREDENAVDSLDWVSLVTIDHEPGADLTLSPDGRMYDILLTVPPSSAVDDRGVDVLQEILYVDNIFYVRDDSGWIDLTYEGLDTMSLCLETTTSGSSVIPPAKGITGLITGRPRPNILTISVMDDAGNWNVVERAFPRRRPQPFFVDLSEHFAASIQVRYKWTRRYRADFIGFSWVRLLRSGISLLKPSIAVLNDSIKVLNTLRRPDNRFVGFVSEEFINLSFPYYQIPEDKTRDFVFLCRGKYYVSDSLNPPKIASDDLLPKELSLNQNYPNPFNSNTIIRFANPEDQFISIKIYNILGQEVTTLLSETVIAGYHEIIWDGKNSADGSVSSGIYFYKLSTENRQIKKKMLLLR